MSEKRKELLKHFNEITKEYHQHCEWTNDKYSAVEQIRQLIQQKSKIKLPEKRGLTVDEIIQKYPGSIKILLSELISKLDQQKPEIDDMEKYIKEKATYMFEHEWKRWILDNGDASKEEIIEEYADFITQIVNDVKGRGK